MFPGHFEVDFEIKLEAKIEVDAEVETEAEAEADDEFVSKSSANRNMTDSILASTIVLAIFTAVLNSGGDDNECAILGVPLSVPVNEIIEKPAVAFLVPELSRLPTLVALASLDHAVPALQHQATIDFPLPFKAPFETFQFSIFRILAVDADIVR